MRRSGPEGRTAAANPVPTGHGKFREQPGPARRINEQVRQFILIFSLLIGAALLFPGCENQSGYQDMLWTSRHDPWNAGGWQIDNGISLDGVSKWRRWRFGWPLQAVTLDIQHDTGAWQSRVETRVAGLNFFLCLLIAAAGSNFIGRFRKPGRRHLHPSEF